MSSDFSDIQKLAELLRTCDKKHSDSDDDPLDTNESNQETKSPETSGTQSVEKKPRPYAKIIPKKTINNEDIANFLLEDEESQPATDWKKYPEWDISYSQKVTASDVFLQMGPKNPSTACCENMIVTVNLPGEDHHNIDLKVQKDTLQLTSPTYYLDMPLPHLVDPQLGNAKWDASQEKLIITLQMEREFDFMNF